MSRRVRWLGAGLLDGMVGADPVRTERRGQRTPELRRDECRFEPKADGSDPTEGRHVDQYRRDTPTVAHRRARSAGWFARSSGWGWSHRVGCDRIPSPELAATSAVHRFVAVEGSHPPRGRIRARASDEMQNLASHPTSGHRPGTAEVRAQAMVAPAASAQAEQHQRGRRHTRTLRDVSASAQGEATTTTTAATERPPTTKSPPAGRRIAIGASGVSAERVGCQSGWEFAGDPVVSVRSVSLLLVCPSLSSS